MDLQSHSYYVHNLSPYIFTLDNIDFTWLATLKGGGLFAAAVVLIFVLLRTVGKKIERWVMPVFTTGVFLTLAMFALQKLGVQRGLRWYSTMYLLGFLFFYVMSARWIQKRVMMLTTELLDSLIGYCVFGMILGARFAYVFIYNWDIYSKHPSDIIRVWEGGLSFHGGIVGVVIALILFTRKNKIRFFHLADKITLCVPFGIAMGRIGNFMNGELYGRIIDSHVPWAVVFNIGYGGVNLGGGPQPRHPSQLYQSLGEGWLLLLTLFLISRRPQREGTIASCFLMFYCVFRFFVEYFREADEQLKYYFNNTTTMGQILCFLFFLVGLCLFIYTRGFPMEGAQAWRRNLDDFYARQNELNKVKGS